MRITNSQFWVDYRNYLMLQAVYMDIHTIEYRNINRRIDYCWKRAYSC